MKAQYAAELAEGSRVDTAFVVRAKEMRTTRAGEAYLSLELADRSGRLSAVWFRPDPALAAVPVSTVVRVRGVVTSFRRTKRISIDSLRVEETYEPVDYLAPGPRDEAELMTALRAFTTSLSDRRFSAVVKRVFGDPSFLVRFKICPASQSYHHAYLGGLLEHTVAVAGLCDRLADSYPGTDRDTLLAAALLHDIGKVDELACETSIAYTDAGRLIGHVTLGLRRITDAIAACGLDARLDRLLSLQHAVLSHHGELEWGSPKRPSTLEALLLHHADNLDAKASGFLAVTAGACRAEEAWTDASNLFRRPLYAPRPASDDRPAPVLEDEQSCLLSA